MGGMPTQITAAPPLPASFMNCATRCAYSVFHCGDVYGTSGGPMKSWASLAPIMTTTTCGCAILRSDVSSAGQLK